MTHLHRATDPDTSVIAASRSGEFAPIHAAAIYAALHEVYPGTLTIYEIADRTGLTHVQVARRLPIDLRDFAETTEDRRPSPSGRMCRVWRAVVR